MTLTSLIYSKLRSTDLHWWISEEELKFQCPSLIS